MLSRILFDTLGGICMNDKLQQEKETFHKKGVKVVQIKVDALLVLDEQGFVTGIKLPDEAEFLGKKFEQ